MAYCKGCHSYGHAEWDCPKLGGKPVVIPESGKGSAAEVKRLRKELKERDQTIARLEAEVQDLRSQLSVTSRKCDNPECDQTVTGRARACSAKCRKAISRRK